MFNEWIDITVLARAYELNCEECLELAKRVKVKLGQVTFGRIVGPSNIEDCSKSWAEHIVQEGINEKKIQHVNMMIKVVNAAWWSRPIPEFEASGDKNFDYFSLYIICRAFLVTDLSVNKKEAIQLLNFHDYILKNECNGLTLKTIQAVQNENSHLAAPNAELDQARAELAALREENAALKAELEEARQEKGQDAPKWYGLIAVVEQCRSEGKTPQETAVELKARGASYAIIGGLLHPEGDISDWTQYGSNIVEGNTKKLAW